MIRRSTLVTLTCLAALSAPAIHAPVQAQLPAAQLAAQVIAQASGGSFTNSLDVGAKGEAVKALQRRLQQNNFYSDPIDGIYGLATQRAVSAFQSEMGLDSTGSMNDETWQKLQSLPTESADDTTLPPVTAEASLETAPTASELPSGDGDDAAAVETENEGGLLKTFGLSLGLAAIAAGIGGALFVFNRRKAVASNEDDGWGEVDVNPALPLQNSANRVSHAASQVIRSDRAEQAQFTQAPSAQTVIQGGRTVLQSNGRSVANGNGAGGQIATQSSGQMGEATPLAQVDVIQGLIGDLRNPDPTRRRKVIWELGQRGNSLAVQPLVDAMVDADSKEKSLLLASLSEIGMRSLKPMNRALAIALQDDNPEVRKNAIRDLTRIYELVVQISHMLGHATEDEDPEVRQTATWALEQLNRIRRTQDVDSNMRSFTSGVAAPIDMLSSEASIRRSQQS
jgi:peptidoglycan hydrolase-like protein with peptidoglycan-binding domain